ncbi:histone deacetylase family protein [Stakelama sp. CBK3Z-3]|uniref:Histone deacetylase family protein n=1 Tax=Stakelama flava TaxID=2860338 RepID=A0ABS6XKG7_9SPHN|nr:histone deacetylase family protein [Stakelama flava]MBW4330699.1 histone deacetylase family protein [Stakelama flava]
MRIFHHPDQALHRPERELHNGGFVAYAEDARRIESILAVLGEPEMPDDRGEGPIRAVHDGDYVDFLKSAYARWKAAGRDGDAFGYAWPVVGRRPLTLNRIDGDLGRYSFDAASPISQGTWEAAYATAQTAIGACDAVLRGEGAAFALCRPPGHHAGHDYLGGYCYLNAAAIAAQHARDNGVARVAILDIDYHHGNGTQDIFYTRGDVFYASLHADPATDFPFYWGHADETGEGAGQGATLNLPLARGTTLAAFRSAQAKALDAIAAFDPGMLIVSLGVDTWDGDPISQFAIRTQDYRALAADIAARGWPTAILMEGGYAIEALGANVESFLSGFPG